MMEAIITSTVLIIVILILRTALKGRVKSRFRYALWLIAAVRLLIPFPLAESRVSVMNFVGDGISAVQREETVSDVPGEVTGEDLLMYGDISGDVIGETLSGENILPASIPEADSAVYSDNILPDFEPENLTENDRGIAPGERAVINKTGNVSNETEDISGEETEESNETRDPKAIAKAVYFSAAALAALWLIGVNVSFYAKLRKNRVRIQADCPLPVYRVQGLGSPCLFGGSIYVTEQTAGKGLRYVIAHEYCHYRHGDMIWSLLRGVLLCAYWFDPFVWAAAFVSKRDCECACDEAAIALLGEQHRLDYGSALVEMIPGRRAVMGVCSTSMSGRGRALRERLTLIAGDHKYKRAAAVIGVLSVMAVSGCTFTSAVSPAEDDVEGNKALSYRDISGDLEDYEQKKEAYLRSYDNYKEYYEDRAVAEVYYDESLINVGNDNDYTWVFNLWIKYRNGVTMRVPVNYFPADNEFHKGEAAEDGNIPENITLLPDMPYEQVLEKSWDEYVNRNYPGYLYDEKLNGEPVENVWIRPVEYDSNSGYAHAGFLAESENYYQGFGRGYYENDYGRYEWGWRSGDNSIPVPKDVIVDFSADECIRAVPLSEYYSRQKFHPGDVIYSFEKLVPLSDGSGEREYTVELIMTREDYPNGLPGRNYELQGAFALRLRDSGGNITGECPISTADVDENGNMTLLAHRDYLSLYFRSAIGTDRLLTFSVPISYNDGWRFYTAFYGITDEGELFPYHIDSGEFDYPVYMGGNELFTGELESNSRLYSENGHFVNKGEQYLVTRYPDSGSREIFSVLLFDETAHLIKNAFTLEGERDESLLTEAESLIADRYTELFMRHLGEEANKTAYSADDPELKNKIFDNCSIDDYINMSMGEISENNMFYALSAGAEAKHPGVEDMTPFAVSGRDEYGWKYISDCSGYSGIFVSDMAAVSRDEDGKTYFYFISFGTDYYNVCRYAVRENDDSLVLSEFERIL